MEHKYNVRSRVNNSMMEAYFLLLQNLPEVAKLELITMISNSIIQDKSRNSNGRTKTEILNKTYGSFESSKSADEMIDEITKARYFEDKELQHLINSSIPPLKNQ